MLVPCYSVEYKPRDSVFGWFITSINQGDRGIHYLAGPTVAGGLKG